MKQQWYNLFILFMIFIMPASAQDTTPTLPVLRVTMDGQFTKGMSYVNGYMQLTDVDGTVVEMPAKFKTRGATASEYMMKPSFNMKLRNADYTEEADTTLLGLRECSSWILDAMAIDRICMRNRVCMDIWNDFSKLPYDTDFGGRNGTIGKFLEVYINNAYYGIYCMSDRINRKLLNLKKVKITDDETPLLRGVLYKSGTTDIDDQNNPGYNSDYTACTVEWHNAWELTYPDDYASEAVWAPLQDAFNNGQSEAYVNKYFYIDNLADYQIHVMALSIADNWGNKNHFLSIRNMNKNIDDPDSTESNRRRFVITPWDLDTSLGGDYNGSLYDGTYSDWPVASIGGNAPYPITYISGKQYYENLLKEKWIAARRGAFSVDSINTKLERYRDLFINSGAWSRMVNHFNAAKYQPQYVQDLSKEIAYIEEWYRQRVQEMDSYFNITGEDVNQDGKVDTQDALAIYELMQSGNSLGLSNIEDVNLDGSVDTQDVLTVYEYIKSH